MLVIGIGRAVQMAVSMASLRVITAFLAPSEAGRRFVILSLTAFFALMLVNPIGMYINRKTHQWVDDGSIFQKLDIFWGFLAVVATVAFSILFTLSRTVGLGVHLSPLWLLILTSGSLLISTANLTLTTLLNMIGARVAFVVTTSATLLLGLAASIALVLLRHATAEYWLLGTLLGQSAVMVAAYFLLRARINLRTAAKLRLGRLATYTPIFAFTWPLSLAVGLNWVQTQSYRFILGGQAGLHAVGLFATGYAISAAIMGAFESLFQQYYLPIYYREVASGEARAVADAWSSMAAYLMPPLLLIGIFLASAGHFLIRVMVSSAFQGVEPYLLWGAAAEFARVLGNAYALLAHARLEMRSLLWPNLVGALVATGTIWLVGRQLGPATGVGLGLTLAGIAVLTSLHFHYARSLPLKFSWGRLGTATGLAIPMALLGVFLAYVWRSPSVPQALMALCILASLLATGILLVTRNNPQSRSRVVDDPMKLAS